MSLDGVHFAEREVKGRVDWLLRIVYEENMLSDIAWTSMPDGEWI